MDSVGERGIKPNGAEECRTGQFRTGKNMQWRTVQVCARYCRTVQNMTGPYRTMQISPGQCKTVQNSARQCKMQNSTGQLRKVQSGVGQWRAVRDGAGQCMAVQDSARHCRAVQAHFIAIPEYPEKAAVVRLLEITHPVLFCHLIIRPIHSIQIVLQLWVWTQVNGRHFRCFSFLNWLNVNQAPIYSASTDQMSEAEFLVPDWGI
jgi:hypothetical protein